MDGEITPSIEFIPSRACGVGFDNQAAPWGTKWFGKAAKATGWFHNFRIPFKSIRITYQLETNETDQHIFLIVRGLENYKFTIGDIPVPTTARLKLIKTNVTLQPLEFVDLVNIQHGSGMLFFNNDASIQSKHKFSGRLFSFLQSKICRLAWHVNVCTGTEDYYDSAYYFDGGEYHMPVSEYHMPVSGFTNYIPATANTTAKWSAYRFHEMDPIVFSQGMRFQWRNGDMENTATGKKTLSKSGGTIVGSPVESELFSLMWVYQW